MHAETRQEFLVRLKRLKDSGAPWHEIAGALRERTEGSNAAYWKMLLADAARDLAMSPVVLARYVSLLDRLHGMASSPAELESLMPPRFSSGEIAARLYDRDPAKGLQAFKDLRERKTTLEKLRVALSNEAVPRNRSRGRSLQDRARAVTDAEKLLASRAGRLFGAGSRIVRRPPLRHLAREGFDILSPKGDRIAGADLYLPEPPASGRDALEPLARSVLLSFYSRRFYLVFAPGFGETDLCRAARVLDVFGATWIGILWMVDGQTVAQHRAPSTGPEPDRSGMYDRLRHGLHHHRWTEGAA